MAHRRVPYLAALLVIGASSGCLIRSTGSSCDAKTSGISMVAVVVDDGASVRAEADFEFGDRTGLGTILELCDDDVLTINGTEPNEQEFADRIVYSATFEVAQVDYTFELDRKDGDSFVATVTAAPSFMITAPIPDEELPRSADTTITWEPAGTGELELSLGEDVDGDICLATPDGDDYKYSVAVPDAGSWLVPAGTLQLEDPEAPASDSCAASWTLTRSTPGAYPEVLEEGGSVEARVERTVSFVSVQ